MKKTEAIKILNKYDLNFCDIDGNPIPPQDLAEAFDMAIKALEQEKRGKWIRNDNGTYSCSLCQSWIPEEQYHYARFCLQCGVRMESDEQ